MGVPTKIGLEIHGYLDIPSNVKLFCNCSLAPGEPNTNICPVCTGQPGSKPMLPNKEAVEAILKIALFLECELNKELLWQRKHYSWPDLPNGYQKTMSGAYSQPVGLNGKYRNIGIEEIHLEEDPARWDPISGGVDYNRSGYPLVEIVTKPDFTSAEQVRDWIENLMIDLGYISAVQRKLGIKCDVNVSIGPKFIRTEVKNVNSFSAIVDSIEYEVKRQQKDKAKLQTRAWDERTGTTQFMRDKETAMDYQFIPDPDLPIIHVNQAIIEKISLQLPEQSEKKQKNMEKEGIKSETAKILTKNLYFSNVFENTISKMSIDRMFLADRFANEILGPANELARQMDAIQRSSTLNLINNLNEITKQAHQLNVNLSNNYLLEAIKNQVDPLKAISQELERNQKFISTILEATHNRSIMTKDLREMVQVALENPSQIEEISKKIKPKHPVENLTPLVKEAIASNPKAAEDVRIGNDKAINAIVGFVLGRLKKDGKSADPAVIQKLIKENI